MVSVSRLEVGATGVSHRYGRNREFMGLVFLRERFVEAAC